MKRDPPDGESGSIRKSGGVAGSIWEEPYLQRVLDCDGKFKRPVRLSELVAYLSDVWMDDVLMSSHTG